MLGAGVLVWSWIRLVPVGKGSNGGVCHVGWNKFAVDAVCKVGIVVIVGKI